MEILALLEALHSDYLSEFEIAYYQQADLNQEVFPEIAFEISGTLYRGLFVVDLMAKNGEDISAIEVGLSSTAYGGETSLPYESLTMEFGLVAWDSMRFVLEPAPEELIGFASWFDKWIDLDGQRRIDGQVFSGVIHSARLGGDVVEVDFGSAPTEAATELFDLLDANEVRVVTVSSGRE